MRPRASFIVISYVLLCLAGGFSLVMPDSAAMSGVATGQTVQTAGPQIATAVDAEARELVDHTGLQP